LLVVDERDMIGSLSIVTGKPMRGDKILPDWLEQGIESSLRDSPDDVIAKPFTPVVTAISSVTSSRSSARATPIVLTPAESASPAGSGMRVGGAQGQWKDLDEFYAEAHSEEEQDSDTEEDDDNDTESESGEEESGTGSEANEGREGSDLESSHDEREG
jgi:AP-3 complex subunit beta